jgi:hypothetical protein
MISAAFLDRRSPITWKAEVLLLCLLAVLSGAEDFVTIARWGQGRINFLRRFLPFKDGTPSHDQLGDIFATLDATIFQRCFVAWVASITAVSADVIAIDGKTSRRSADKKRKGRDPYGVRFRGAPASGARPGQGRG